ncbi:Hypothetical predicted protein [Argonauta hians]
MAFSTRFPPYNFHSTLWDLGERNDFFSDCGSVFGIHIDKTRNATVQKEHQSCQGRHLYAQFSSLPLFQKPKVFQETDAIGIQQLCYTNNRMTSLHKRLTMMKTQCYEDVHWRQYLLNTLKAVYAAEEGKIAESKALEMFNKDNSLHNFYEDLGDFLDIQNVWHSNHKFIGGCLQMLNLPSLTDSRISLAAITGPEFKTIKIVLPQKQDSNLLTIDGESVHEIKVNEEMFDLSCRTVGDTTYCLSRGCSKCFLHEVTCGNDGEISSSLKSSVHQKQKTYTSVDLSGYILGECLLADHTGSVSLWNINQSLQEVLSQHPHRFPCKSNWCKAHFASHPRSFVFTNQSAMELMDIRMSCRKSRDAFVLPSKFLLKNELISASCCSRSNPFHHFVATNNALFLIDERFLGHPVLQWHHMLEGVPHYLSPIPATDQLPSSVNHILAASQYPNEVVCIQYRTGPNDPPISMCSPWRISRPGDVFYTEKLVNPIKDSAAHERLYGPVVGAAGGAVNPEGMYVFQLNSLGDIFYQAYGMTDSYEDKTCSAGPGMLESAKGHVLCQLCMSQCDNQDIDSDDEEIGSGKCDACHSEFLTSKYLIAAIQRDGVTKSSVPCSKTIPALDAPAGANRTLSKKLYKQWMDEEFTSQDETEEEEVEEEAVNNEDGPQKKPSSNVPSSNEDDLTATTSQLYKEFGSQPTQPMFLLPSLTQTTSRSSPKTPVPASYSSSQIHTPNQNTTISAPLIPKSIPSSLPQLSPTLYKSHTSDQTMQPNSQSIFSQTLDSKLVTPPTTSHRISYSKSSFSKKRLFTNSNTIIRSPPSSNTFQDGFAKSPSNERLVSFSQQSRIIPRLHSSMFTSYSQPFKTNEKQKYQEGF